MGRAPEGEGDSVLCRHADAVTQDADSGLHGRLIREVPSALEARVDLADGDGRQDEVEEVARARRSAVFPQVPCPGCGDGHGDSPRDRSLQYTNRTGTVSVRYE